MADDRDTPAARRRRRRRAGAAQGAPPSGRKDPPAEPSGSATESAATTALADPDAGPRATQPIVKPVAKRAPKPRRGSGGNAERAGERGLRAIVGAGPSQLGVTGALRARDVNRPTEDDLAEAEREIEIVRRHWKPDIRR